MSDSPTTADPITAEPPANASSLATTGDSVAPQGAATAASIGNPPVPTPSTDPFLTPADATAVSPSAAPAAATPVASGQPVNNPSAYAAPASAGPADSATAPDVVSDAPATPPEPVDPAVEANKVGFDVRFIDFAGRPILGLQHKIIMTENGRRLEFPATSDPQGRGAAMYGLEVSTPIEIWIRKDNGTYVLRHKGTVGCKDTSICMVSPHIKLSIATELHAGAAGSPLAKPTAPDPSVEKRPNAPLTQASGGKLPDATLTAGRDAKGNPVATAAVASTDSNGKSRLPTLGLFTWGRSGDAPATTPLKVPPLHAGARVDAAKVAELLTTMEQQVTWDWVKLKRIYGNSGNMKLAMVAKTFNYEPETKDAKVFGGQCYSSVKVGLWRAGLVEGVEGGVRPATEARPWLLSQGFVDVTAQLPDARWAAPGDVITYRYDDVTLAANEAKIASALKQYDADVKALPSKQQAYEEAHKAWVQRQSSPSLAQLAARNPGAGKGAAKARDPEPKPPTAPERPQGENYGHIDVRGYGDYFSDAKAAKLPSPTAHGSVKGFVVNGIFRKMYDDQPDLRVRAFLKCIREWEGHAEQDDSQRYFKVYGGKSFTDVSGHPFENLEVDHSPAGAYQIRLATYHDNIAPKSDIPAGFSPAIQDRIAVRLIEGRGALGLIRQGKIREAVPMLTAEWSSLPGSTKGARHEIRNKQDYVFTMDDLCAAHAAFMNSK